MDFEICFPDDFSLHSPDYYMSSSLFFAGLLCLSDWQFAENKRCHCHWHCSFYAKKFACDTNLILPETRQVSYKFLLHKRSSLLLPALYMQYTLNWGKSFLFISPLYMPDKVWLSFCENMVHLHFCSSHPIHCHTDSWSHDHTGSNMDAAFCFGCFSEGGLPELLPQKSSLTGWWLGSQLAW